MNRNINEYKFIYLYIYIYMYLTCKWNVCSLLLVSEMVSNGRKNPLK